MFWRKRKKNVEVAENKETELSSVDKAVAMLAPEYAWQEVDEYAILLEALAKEVGCERESRMEFDYTDWDNQASTDISEMQKRIDNMKLVGRVIKDIRFTSYIYGERGSWFGNTLDDFAEAYCKNAEIGKGFEGIIENLPDNPKFELDFMMDDPVIIEFEDGNRFEILTFVEGSFIATMNELPWNVKGKVNIETINASKLIDFCKGGVITKVEVEGGKTDFAEDGVLVVRIFWKTDVEYFFEFSSIAHDYMAVSVGNSNFEILRVPYKKALKSMYKPS